MTSGVKGEEGIVSFVAIAEDLILQCRICRESWHRISNLLEWECLIRLLKIAVASDLFFHIFVLA